MKKILSKIEDSEFSTREYFFMGIILFFIGLFLGLVFSPKGERTIGSNNGNNNGNNNSGCLTEETKDTDDLKSESHCA